MERCGALTGSFKLFNTCAGGGSPLPPSCPAGLRFLNEPFIATSATFRAPAFRLKAKRGLAIVFCAASMFHRLCSLSTKWKRWLLGSHC